MSAVIRDLAVVNDTAERCIKDIQDYANAANGGDHRGNIILVSASHGIKIPSFLKYEMEENLWSLYFSAENRYFCWTNNLLRYLMYGYRNWPRYGLRWSGLYCHQAQHEVCRPSRGRAGLHNSCCAWWQYHPRQRRPYKWSISILPRSQFYKKQGKPAFSTFCTAVRPHRRLRIDAWRRDS